MTIVLSPRTSARRHPCAVSRSDFIRWGCRSVKSWVRWTGWVSIASFQAVWNWKERLAETQSDPPTATPSRVAVDETQIEVDGEKKWLYAAIDTDSKLVLEVDVYSRRGTDPAAAFLYRLTEKHAVSETEFLVDAGGYLTALARQELSGQLNYTTRKHIEKWFQTVTMRIDRFHSFWRGSQASATRWLRRFRYYYNRQRPNQALNGRTPVQEVLN